MNGNGTEQLSSFFQKWLAIYPDRRGRKGDLEKAYEAFSALPTRERPRLMRATRHYARSYRPMRGFAMDACRFILNGEWLRYVDGAPDPYEPEAPFNGNGHVPVGSQRGIMPDYAANHDVIIVDYEGIDD